MQSVALYGFRAGSRGDLSRTRVCVRLCELLGESVFLFPVTCNFEVGGREKIPLESLACSKDFRLVVFLPTRPLWGEVSFMPGAIGPTGLVHWDMRETFPWPFRV